MRSRRLISFVALLGVLLHAGALVRHSTTMLGALLQHQALVTDLAQICHSAGTTTTVADAELPIVPKPTDAQYGCPLCSGMGAAFALVAPTLAAIMLPPPAAPPALHADATSIPESPRAVHPPARGPPALA